MARREQSRGIFGTGADRICAVVAAETARDAARQLRAALRETRTIELRLDWLRNEKEEIDFFAWFRRRRFQAQFLATCRRKPNGGRFARGIGDQVAALFVAGICGCRWCDLEIESVRNFPRGILRKLFPKTRILVSFHHFRQTPKDLRAILSEGRGWSADCVKIATQAINLSDSLRVLRLARGQQDVVAVPMGEVGLPARILALREGSTLAFAPVETPTAPGQVSLYELKHLYRAHKLTRHTRVYGVIGDPVGHSLSPLLHNTGFIEKKLDAVYLPILVKDLRDFLKAVPEFGLRGFSVTLPHKQAILRHLKECEPLAAEIGAVNTVAVRGDGSFYGCNTDYVGVLRALQSRLRLAGSRVLIFGAGGSARAAAIALARAGAFVAVCARREGQARQLARAVGGEAIPRRALRTECFDAILNTTPVGMHPHGGISPLLPGELHCRIVMDLIYRPQETRLLKIAARGGCETVSGVEMFLAQGIAQWEIWTGQRAPEAAMRRAVLRELRKEERPSSARGRR